MRKWLGHFPMLDPDDDSDEYVAMVLSHIREHGRIGVDDRKGYEHVPATREKRPAYDWHGYIWATSFDHCGLAVIDLTS